MPLEVSSSIDWKNFHRRLQEEIDIVEVLRLIGVHVEERGNGFKVRCPFHDDSTPSMHVYLDTNSVHCFGSCDRSWGTISLYAKGMGVKYIDAADELGDRFGIDPGGRVQSFAFLDRTTVRNQRYEREELPEPMSSKRAEYYHGCLKPEHRSWYEITRLIPGWLIDKWKLGHLPVNGFPVGYSIPVWGETLDELITIRFRRDDWLFKKRKEELSPQRVTWMEDRKYWGVKGRNGVYPFGLWWIKWWEDSGDDMEYVILTESELGCLALIGNGFPAMTLTMGASERRWPGWVHCIEGFENWVVAFDDDEAGRSAAGGMELMWPSRVKQFPWPSGKWWPDHEESGDVTAFLKQRGLGAFNDRVQMVLEERREGAADIASRYWRGVQDMSSSYWNKEHDNEQREANGHRT